MDSEIRVKRDDKEVAGLHREGLGERAARSFLDLLILKSLTSGPKYGSQLVRELEDETGIQVSFGTIYPLLWDLEKSGLVRSDWNSDERKSKRFYTITRKGLEHQEMMLEGLGSLISTIPNRIKI